MPYEARRDAWDAVPLDDQSLLPSLVSRLAGRPLSPHPRRYLRPVGPGRCRFEYDHRNGIDANAPTEHHPMLDSYVSGSGEVWQLESWHMLDWMVSAQFRGTTRARRRYHWLKHRTPEAAWYGLRRWLLWSGRRVEAIGQRNNLIDPKLRPHAVSQDPQSP